MREYVRERPWIWVLVLLGVLVSASLSMVWIALEHPVVMVAK